MAGATESTYIPTRANRGIEFRRVSLNISFSSISTQPKKIDHPNTTLAQSSAYPYAADELRTLYHTCHLSPRGNIPPSVLGTPELLAPLTRRYSGLPGTQCTSPLAADSHPACNS